MAKIIGKNERRPTHEEIERQAYLLFEQSGRVPGRDLENWLAAEAHLNSGRKSKTAEPPSAQAVARPTGQETGQRRI